LVTAFILFLIIIHFIYNKKIFTKNNVLIVTILIISIPTTSLLGIFKGTKEYHSAQFSFILGHMIENGTFQTYLDKNCPNLPFNICSKTNKLPKNSDDFLWSENTLLSELGGLNDQEKKQEKMVKNAFTDPKLVSMYIYKSVIGTFKQITRFSPDMVSISHYMEGPAIRNINRYYKHETNEVLGSKQNTNQIEIKDISKIQYLIITILILTNIYIVPKIYKNYKFKNELLFLIMTTTTILTNGAVTATISTINDRYTSRLVWVFIIPSALILFKYIFYKKVNKRKY